MSLEKIEIVITDKRLIDLGIDAEEGITELTFRSGSLHGYWIAESDDGSPDEIMAYVGHTNVCIPYNEANIEKLNEILSR
jgi:hypothetical protein